MVPREGEIGLEVYHRVDAIVVIGAAIGGGTDFVAGADTDAGGGAKAPEAPE